MENKMSKKIDTKKIPLVSIVIPIYNAEKYVAECIESILKQTYNFYELILVIDGSLDKSGEICKLYKDRDSRVRIIEKENGGVSSARNTGIEYARGEYLLFVDADDYIKPSMIQKMIDSAIKNDSDIVFCGFEVNGSNLVLNDTESLSILKECKTKEPVIQAIISTSKHRIYGYIWRNLFRRRLLAEKKIIFPQNIKISEDFMFLLNAVDTASKVSIVDEELYVYRINGISTTAKYMPTLHSDMSRINKWMLEEICTKYPDTIPGYHCCAANTYLRHIQNLCRKGTPFEYSNRVIEATKIKKANNYQINLREALKQWKNITNKNRLSYLALFAHLDFIYIFLFSCKMKNIWKGESL